MSAEAPDHAGEREARALELRLADLEEDLADLTYAVSHDLQEPVRKIASFGELLSRGARESLEPDQRRQLEIMVSAAERLRAQIGALLELSRAGRELALESVDLGALVARVVSDLSVRIEAAGAEVSIGPLPALRGDPRLLGSLFRHLIANALEFRGAEPVRVRIEAECADGECRVSVCDNGIGIAPDQHDRIFKPFQRLHARGEHPGNGMGLAVCLKIARRHRGRLWVESSPGAGARFCLALPEAGPP